MKLTLATWDHDRVMPLHDGRVTVPGVAFDSHILPTGKLFPLAVQEARFDITELSVSSYVLQVSRGESAYTAIPAFISRAFRHSGFYAHRDARIETLADLADKRVGVPEYQMTAALWMRGLLADEYGVDCTKLHWRTGALDTGVRHERLALDLPDGMVVAPIKDGETLQDLLLAGEIDALLAPNPPKAFLENDPAIRRIILDFGPAERAYHRKTGFFPIMHLIGVRKSLVTAHPWLPKALLDGFTKARDIALDRLNAVWLGSANRLSLPWLNEAMEATRAAMGQDYWPYGFEANRKELTAICRYSSAQYLAARPVSPEELFPEAVR
ncbi:substrate-binding domain-containing protein [Roseobacter weihaiensis]|uniref:4,5-dihydroxyphthalate decarboxylase n=1 Tax=Roseobacter weihaiensis TaxID=2763262 RepID=UPI001D0B5C33|nr:4,5-dihydroxyphthalate decarboxylase [Roseobacter sp. H9]